MYKKKKKSILSSARDCCCPLECEALNVYETTANALSKAAPTFICPFD